ncbi:MAG: N-formylglutamate amidohydrolase [Nannocystaceae bacterium]
MTRPDRSDARPPEPPHAGSHAVELRTSGSDGRLLITCDHASPDLHEPWRWHADDRWLSGTHWAYDLGAADITRALAAHLGCPAVLARFSRLLIDPNRALHSDTLFRYRAEGRRICLNRALTKGDRDHRTNRWYLPYHNAIDRLTHETPAASLLSIHTFTPNYEGEKRSLEAGVLFTEHEARAREFTAVLRSHGYHTGLNEPYSGRDGLMYGIERHAIAHGRAALEIEVRQDIASDPRRRRTMVDALADATRRTLLAASP